MSSRQHPYGLRSQKLPRDARSLAALPLLQELGTHRHRHSLGRSLFEHLVSTAQILLAWNAPIATVRAGLCHSLYGTRALQKISLPHEERPRLQALIGRRAEHLAWLFSQLGRPAPVPRALRQGHSLVRLRSGRTRRLPRQDLEQLFLIECANLFDQRISLPRSIALRRLARRVMPDETLMHASLRDQHQRTLLARCHHGQGTQAQH